MTTSVIKHPSDCPKCAICQCRCCINKRTKCSRVKKAFIQSEIQLNCNERRCVLILVRHGTSQDEVDKRYSGWNDCDISNIGKEQMHRTGQALHQANFSIDICFTSVLKRTSKSLFIIQEEMDYLWLPVYNTWRLNDRMLGSLTGFHRDRAEALFGQNQIKEWLTRSELAPPLLEESNAFHPRLHYKYRYISSIVPSTEALVDIRKRVIPFFYDQLLDNIYLGKNILIVTHEDIIKAIIRLLNNYTVDEFDNQEIPIGIPIIFEFSSNTHQLFNGYYLSSSLFESNTNNQHQLFPTGFGSDSEKINSTKDIIKQSSSPNVDSTLFKEEPNLHIKQNFTDAIYPSTDTNSELSKQKS
jgi:2,3-bisphosphoglycerate-dependent phosphoglycerate mutase